MKITLRLFATLRAYSPPGAKNGEIEYEVAEGTTPRQVIELPTLRNRKINRNRYPTPPHHLPP